MEAKHRVVVIGGGFAGLNAARSLREAPARVTLIDRRNHHVFQPLLYQVATGGLSPADISAPIRALVRKQKNLGVVLGEVESIDANSRVVRLSDGEEMGYDTLVVATGARHSYFGNDSWADDAPGLKTVEDALEIRRRILLAFEAAERASDLGEREAWLTIAVIGGGPTGVELAGAIAELARGTLKDDFRSIDPATARILLLEGGDRVLSTFRPGLSGKALKALHRLGVTVSTGTLVSDVGPDGLETTVDGRTEHLRCKTVIWAAGVSASSLGQDVAAATGAEVDRIGRVIVNADFSVPGHPEIFVVGDLASYDHQTGEPLRGTADVAISEGTYVGKAISRKLRGRPSKPFNFRDLGTLAVIGRSAAVADLRVLRLSGRLAWWVWLFIHLLKLVDFQNRMTVFVQWGWSYFTRNRSARLITGGSRSPFSRPRPNGTRGRDNGTSNGAGGGPRRHMQWSETTRT